MNTPKYLILHHSAGPRSQTTAQIRTFHMKTVAEGGRGWDDIGYQKVIEEDGSVHQGRPDDQIGAHAPGYNDKSLGICVVGDFSKYALNTYHPQYRTLIQVCAALCKRYKIPVKNIIGHRDTKKTECPGAIHILLPVLRLDVAPYLKGKL